VPITGTKRWLHLLREELDLPEVRPWREWWVPGKHAGEDQIGGDTWELQGLTFASVKGAGHLVPSNKPFPSLVMVESFLRGSPLPFR
jgi:serine carboxypeptidase-like clade II